MSEYVNADFDIDQIGPEHLHDCLECEASVWCEVRNCEGPVPIPDCRCTR